MKTVAITGASGFIGNALTTMLGANGFKIISLERKYIQDTNKLQEILKDVDVVINLAGANILKRWSQAYKKILYNSRINTTRAIIDAMELMNKKPTLLISTSAVGIYPYDNQIHDESSSKFGDSLLSHICQDWEKEALRANGFGIRTAIFRFGVVLGDGGALSTMILPFSFGLGGIIGNGMQPFPFIHIEDLKNAYLHIINNEKLDGIFNLVAPQIITNKEFTKTFGKALHRPTFLTVPKFAIKILFGDGAVVLINGQKVVPRRLLDTGFKFKFKTIKETLNNLLGK
jgi:uncharacterized protein